MLALGVTDAAPGLPCAPSRCPSDNPAVGFYRARGLAVMAVTVAPVPCRGHGVPTELRITTTLSGGDECD